MRRYLVLVIFLVGLFFVGGCSSILSVLELLGLKEMELRIEPFEPFRLTENMLLIAGGPSDELVVIDTEKDEVVRRIKFIEWSGYSDRFTVAHGKVYVCCEGTPVEASRTVFVIYPEEGVGRSVRVSEDEVHSVNVGYDKVIDRVVVFHDWGRLSIVNPNTDKFERKVKLEGSPYIFDIEESEVGIYCKTVFCVEPVYVLDLRNDTYKVITTNDVNQGGISTTEIDIWNVLIVSTNELWHFPWPSTNFIRIYSYPDVSLKEDLELVYGGERIYPIWLNCWYKESNWVIFTGSDDGDWIGKLGIGITDVSNKLLINYVSPSWFSNLSGSGIRISNGKLYLFYSNKFHVFLLPSLEKIKEIKVW